MAKLTFTLAVVSALAISVLGQTAPQYGQVRVACLEITLVY